MKINRMIVLLASVGMMVCVMSWATAQAVNKLAARKTAVAVVSVGQVFEAMDEKTSIEAELQSKRDELESLKNEQSEKIRDLQAEMQLLNRNGPEWKTKAMEAQRMAFMLKAELELQAALLNRENALRKESLYRKILDAVAEVSKTEGYDIVLFKEGEPNFPADQPQQMNAMVEMRKVLYSAEDLDITTKVQTVVNNRFKQGQ